MSKKRFGNKNRNKPTKGKRGNRAFPKPLSKPKGMLQSQAPTNSRVDKSDKGISEEEQSIQRDKGRGDSARLLTSNDPKELISDIKLIDKAISGRTPWNVKRKDMIRQRLEDIVEKETATIFAKDGTPLDCEAKADELAIAASKVLVQMDAIDQKDEHKAMDNKNPASTPSVNINVNNNISNIDERRSKLLELAKRFGARELVIDGSRVESESDIKATDSLPGSVEASESGFKFTTDQTSSETS